VRRYGLRHAHMISVSPALMRAGMRADYRAIDALQDRILSRIGPGSRVRVTSPAGTDCEVTFSPSHRWVKLNGIIEPGHIQNLPSGEVFTCPESLDGRYVANRLATDWFERKYGDLSRFPVTFEIAGGRVRDVRSDNAGLARDLSVYIRSNENADRVAEFGIGTNLWLPNDAETLRFSDKIPGAHISLGEPMGQETGANWTSRTRVTLVGTGMSIAVGDAPIMRDGAFVPDLLRS
jgi:aminopeptidase